MFNYEIIFLILNYIQNESNNKLMASIEINNSQKLENNYRIYLSLYHINNNNNISYKNRYINNNIIYNKVLLSIASINNLCYLIYTNFIIKCYYCNIPLISHTHLYGISNYLCKNIKKCKNNKCKIKETNLKNLKILNKINN